MPPKAKFTRDEIISAAFEIVRSKGPGALTARSLADALNSSPRPIFTVFSGMEEITAEVTIRAKALYAEYVRRGLECSLAFKGVGTQYILFAIREPKLFQLLFMFEHIAVPPLGEVLQLIEDSFEDILASITAAYGFDRGTALRLYYHMWIYSHGIATLCATKMCSFTADDISGMLTEVCTSLVRRLAPLSEERKDSESSVSQQ